MSLLRLTTSISFTMSAGIFFSAVITSSPKNSFPSTVIFLTSRPCASTPLSVMTIPGIFAISDSVSAPVITLYEAALYVMVSPLCEDLTDCSVCTAASSAITELLILHTPASNTSEVFSTSIIFVSYPSSDTLNRYLPFSAPSITAVPSSPLAA